MRERERERDLPMTNAVPGFRFRWVVVVAERQRACAHILMAVSIKAEYKLRRVVRKELCVVSKKRRWDWILKASFLLLC